MSLFHVTSSANTDAVLKDGFGDVMGINMLVAAWVSGERFDWVCHRYLHDANTLFSIGISDKVINEFELLDERKEIRDWLIPASLLKSCGTPVGMNDYDNGEIVRNPDLREAELLVECANERPNVERIQTRHPGLGASTGDILHI